MKTAPATLSKLIALLGKAQTEEDVKAARAKTLGIDKARRATCRLTLLAIK